MYDFKKALKELKEVESRVKGKTLDESLAHVEIYNIFNNAFKTSNTLYGFNVVDGIIRSIEQDIVVVLEEDDEGCKTGGQLILSYKHLEELANSRNYCNRCHTAVAKAK